MPASRRFYARDRSVLHNPTPGGRRRADGAMAYSMHFTVLEVDENVEQAEAVAVQVADILNEHWPEAGDDTR